MWVVVSPSLFDFVARALVYFILVLFVVRFAGWGFLWGCCFVSDPVEGVCRHGLYWCCLLIYRVGGDIIPLQQVAGFCRRVYLLKTRSRRLYLVAELHSFSRSRLLEEGREVAKRIEEYLRASGVLYRRVRFTRRIKCGLRERELDVGGEVSGPCLLVVECGRRSVRAGFYDVFDDRGVDLQRARCFREVDSAVIEKIQKSIVGNVVLPEPEEKGVPIGYPMVGFKVDYSRRVFFKPSPHVLIAGKSGVGKSVLLANLCYVLRKLGYDILVLDWHGEFYSLKYVLNAKWYLVGYNYGINVLQYLDISELIMAMTMTEVYVSSMVREQLISAYSECVKKYGYCTVELLYRELSQMMSRVSGRPDIVSGIDAARRRLEDLLGPEFNEDKFELDFRGVTILDLSILSDYAKSVFVNLMLLLLYLYYIRRGRRLAVVIDEAGNISKGRGARHTSILARVADQGRKYGLLLIVADQQPQSLEESVTGNVSHIFILNPTTEAHRWCSELVGYYTKWSRERIDFELENLRVGECFLVSKPGGVVKVRLLKRFELIDASEVRAKVEKLKMWHRMYVLRRRDELRGGAPVAQKKIRIDKALVFTVAERHKVKAHRLEAVLVSLMKRGVDLEKLEKMVRKGDSFLVSLGLVRFRRGRVELKRLGRAVLEYFRLASST